MNSDFEEKETNFNWFFHGHFVPFHTKMNEIENNRTRFLLQIHHFYPWLLRPLEAKIQK